MTDTKNPAPQIMADTPSAPWMAVDGWQSIFCAPRDGTEVLVWNGRRRHVASFDRIEGGWVSSYKTTTKRLTLAPPPTHWQHLPASPALSANGSDK